MSILKHLKLQNQNVKSLFWTGQAIGIVFIVLGSISIIIYTDRFLPVFVYIPLLIPGILLLWFAYIKKEDQGV